MCIRNTHKWAKYPSWSVWLTQPLLAFLKRSNAWTLFKSCESFVASARRTKSFLLNWLKQAAWNIAGCFSIQTADKNLSILAFVCLPKFLLWHNTMCWLFVLQRTQKRAKEPISSGCRQWETHFSCSMQPRNTNNGWVRTHYWPVLKNELYLNTWTMGKRRLWRIKWVSVFWQYTNVRPKNYIWEKCGIDE